MSEAAVKLGVSNHQIRRLIKQGILAADQVVPDAPYQIRANDLLDGRVTTEIARKSSSVSAEFPEADVHVFRHLKIRCTMNSPLLSRAGNVPSCCCL